MITYITINMSEIALVDFNQVMETSEQTLRLSVDGLQTVLKWEGAEPSFVSTLSSYEGPYTHEEILVIMALQNGLTQHQHHQNNMGAFGGPDIITDGLVFAVDAGSTQKLSGREPCHY